MATNEVAGYVVMRRFHIEGSRIVVDQQWVEAYASILLEAANPYGSPRPLVIDVRMNYQTPAPRLFATIEQAQAWIDAGCPNGD